jgi:SsrA-binding protein
MKIITKNKSAFHEYDIQQTYDVGIVLQWHEVKSIKWWYVNIKDAFVTVSERDLVIINMDIPLYKHATLKQIWGNYQAKGKRVLLATAIERTKIVAKTTKSWLAIIPLEVYLTATWRIKLKIGIGKLLKKIEKKQILKERDLKRETDREIKNM